MPVFNNVLAGAAGAGGGTRDDYTIERSLRFNRADSASLNRTNSSEGNRKTWTWSAWLKRSEDTAGSANQNPWAARPNGNNQQWIRFESSNNSLRLYLEVGSVIKYDITTNQVFRDFGAWFHVVYVYDSTVATASDRVRLYINGVRVTSFASASYPAQNQDGVINQNNETHWIAQRGDGNNYFGGYLADVHFIDGSTPSTATDDANGSVTGTPSVEYLTELGEFDSTTRVWNKKTYQGQYGTNGFRLDFSDASSNASLGNDAVGSNNFTVTNITASAGQEVTVANANGALPVLNTTGNQGGTANSPHAARSDSNSASLELAAPLNTLNDFSGNSRTIGGGGVTLPTTSLARFYGQAAYFNGSAQLTIANVSNIFDFGTGDFTVELWARPDSTSGDQYILSWECPGPNAGHAGFNIYNGNWRLGAFNNDLTGGNTGLAAGQWVHLAMARQGTTLRTFINGVLQNSFTNSSNFSATTDLTLGKYAGNANLRFAGYMNDFRVYKGVAKYTSSFTPPTLANLEAAAGTDSLFDSPDNYDDGTNIGGNFAVLNPFDKSGNAGTYSNGNLSLTKGSGYCTAKSNIGMKSGKWYCEVLRGSGNTVLGVMDESTTPDYLDRQSGGYGYRYDGTKVHNNQGHGNIGGYSSTDIVGLGFDADAKAIYFYKNGNLQGSFTGLTSTPSDPTGVWFFAFSAENTTINVNFGQRPLSHLPSGYKALCTQNFSTPTIVDPSTNFGIIKYTGTGGNRSVTGLNFNSQPEFVWIKNIQNNSNQAHGLFDRARGTKMLSSYVTNTEAQWDGANGYPYRGYVSSFDTNGFSLAGGSAGHHYLNANNIDFMAWCWEMGSAFSNSAGTNNASIASSGYANNTAGMSVVIYSYTGTGAQTYSHGMNAAPDLVIRKPRNLSEDWSVYHRGRGFYYRGHLNNQNSFTATSTWHSTGSPPTSQINRINNSNTGNYVDYCFRSVEGFSAFGVYEGTASTDGPSVYCGFRPRWIITKNADDTGEWAIRDTTRSPFNVSQQVLTADSGEYQQEHSVWDVDILSTGFKIRTASNGSNSNGHTFVYMAFADHPLKYARAR